MPPAKIVARILSEHGHHVSSPDDGDLDDVELERWNVCVEIARAVREDAIKESMSAVTAIWGADLTTTQDALEALVLNMY